MIRRALLALTATCLVVALTGILDTMTSSAQSSRAATTEHMTVRAITPFVGPDGTFSVTIDAHALPVDTRLAFVVHYAITSRSRLDRTIAGEQLGGIITTTTARTLTELGGAANATINLPVSSRWPAPTDGVVLSEAGIYPIEVVATDPTGSRVDSVVTHLLRVPSADTSVSPLAVGTIVTIGATPSVDEDRSPTLSEADAARATRLLSIVDDRSLDTPISLAAEPFVLDVLRRDGTSVTPAGSTIARDTLLQPYVTLDTGSLVAADMGTMIDEQLGVGDASLGSAFEVQPDRRITVIDPTVTPTALERLAGTGATAVVLHSSQIRAALANGESYVLTRRFAIDGADGTRFAAMASDDTVVARFANPDAILGAHDALAELMMLHVEQPSEGRGVAVDLPADIPAASLRAFLEGLSQRGGEASGSIGRAVVDPVTLDEVFTRTTPGTGGTTPTVRDWTSAEPASLGTWPAAIEQARWDLDGLRSTIPDETETVEGIGRDLLVSADRDLDDPSRSALVLGAQAGIRSAAAAISMPSSQTVTLTSRSGKVPLVITNDLATEAHVRVRLDSPKLEFPSGTTIDLVLAPSGTTRADVEVTTRASGAFPLDVTLTSANGKLLLSTSRVSVRSTAVSGWGLVLSIGAGLFLAVWWARHWRSSRRDDLAERTTEPSSDRT